MTNIVSSLAGIDLTSLIPDLVAAQKAPLTALTQRQNLATSTATAFDNLAKLLTSAQTPIDALKKATDWSPLTATSSSANVTVATTSGGVPGSLTFTVGQLATTEAIYSSSTYSGTSAQVMAANSHLLVASGGRVLGLGTLTAGAALPTGTHSITVTQASAAATVSGSSPLGAGTVIDGSNDTLDLEVDGVATSVVLAHATYATAADLAAAVDSALAGHGASASSSSGTLELATTREGSAASLRVVGGSALTPLGLSAAASPTTGTDGIVEVDGTATTVTSVDAGGTVVLAAPTGDVTATLSGGLRTGTVSTRNVDVGDGTLGAVVAAINGATAGVTASAVQVSPGSYRLQLSSATAGSQGGLDLDLSAFQGTGGFTTLTTGQDAQITVSGASPYTITSASNSFTDVIPGLTFTLQPGATGSVTVSTNQNVSALADKVASVVNAVNQALTTIKAQSVSDASTGTSGLLSGSTTVRTLASRLTNALLDPVVGGTPAVTSLAGVKLDKDGTVSFDKAKFTEVYTADPAGTQRLFTSFGTDSTNPGVLERLTTVIDDATRTNTGSLVTAGQSERDSAARMKTQMDEMNRRIDAYETGLRAKFSALQASLENLQNQRNWLGSQLSSLSVG